MNKYIALIVRNPAFTFLGILIIAIFLVGTPVPTSQSAPDATVSATVENQKCQNNDFVSVSLTATVSPPVRNVRFQWDFDNDGIFDTPLSANPNVTHVYPDETKQTATVRAVKGTGSATNSVTFTTVHCGG